MKRKGVEWERKAQLPLSTAAVSRILVYNCGCFQLKNTVPFDVFSRLSKK